MINGAIQRPSGVLAVEKEPTPNIVRCMPAEQYHSIRALSSTGMKELAVSPLHYWSCFLDPQRTPAEPSPEQKFGTALHCLVLEGEEKFHQCYAPMLDESEHEDCLFTIEDMREWLRSKGHKPSGTRKADMIAQVLTVDATVRIWDVLKADHEEATAGKMLCLNEDWNRLLGAAEALKNEPQLAALLSEGEPEVSLFATDPDSGVPLKARLDWLNPGCIVDLKTFTHRRGKSIDQCVNDAIYYESYYVQAYFYRWLYQLATGKRVRFVFVFVESQPPHEVRLRELTPSKMGVANVYWQTAARKVSLSCEAWRYYFDKFGDDPWRQPQSIEELLDEDLRGLVFS